jgi:glutamate racemase
MHILITDSGVGGLSVVAYAERFVRTHGFTEPVKLTFVNAARENDFGYNALPTLEKKIETFDLFLSRVTERFNPELIYIACNTLSVLLPSTPYFRNSTVPVKGIVETGADLMAKALESDPESLAMFFGTQTTIDTGMYPRLLAGRGIQASRIVSQACPGLADTISEDREGTKTAAEIERWIGLALEKMPTPDAYVIACLACTHYGYRRELFAAAFAKAGVRARVINPNERAVDDLFGPRLARGGVAARREVDVRFVTRYVIPESTVEALTWFLSDVSPGTVAAMQHFEHVPDLF